MISRENVESGIVYVVLWIAAHVTLEGATAVVIFLAASMRAAYDGVRLYRYMKKKDQ